MVLQKLNISEEKFKFLRNFNLIMGSFHLIQAIILFIFTDYSVQIPIIATFFDQVPVTPMNPDGVGLVSEVIIEDLPVAAIAPVFILLSAIAHFAIATIFQKKYRRDLENGINAFRWFEYALSSSLMIIIIAMLGGIIEMSALVGIFTLNALMNLFGWLMEKYSPTGEKANWTSYILGVIAGLVPWILIAIHFVNSINNLGGTSENPESGIPSYAVYALVVIFLFFNSFAFNMFFQYKKIGPWKDYLFGEKGYIVLSLLAKSALAWIIFFGIQGA